MTLRRAFAFFCILTCSVVFLGTTRSAFALDACQCTCSDTSIMDRLLTDATDGTDYFETCRVNNVCGSRTLVNAYAYSSSAGMKTACECSSPVISTEIVKRVSGDATCTATCETTCRSQGDSVSVVTEGVQAPKAITTACVTDADCKTGIFSKYKGVTCKTVNGTNTCDIPVTGENGKANANIECANYGGTGMKGSVCDFVASGADPSSYLISRPYFTSSATGLAYNWWFPNISERMTVDELWETLESDSRTYPGVCHLYGLAQSDYSDMDVTALLAQAAVNVTGNESWASSFPGSGKYVCLKRKNSACGTVNIPQSSATPIVKNSLRYSCVSEAVASSKGNTSEYCLNAPSYTSDSGATVKKADLCAKDGELCCAFSCSIDAECGSFKSCVDGECVPNLVCNPNDETWSCRSASSAEKANPDLCLQPLLKPLCQSSSQACCAPPDDDALGNCGADMMNSSYDIFKNGGWKQFSCYGLEELNNAGISMITDYKDGGICILTDVSDAENKAVRRCGSSKYCCQLTASQAGLSDRPAIGSACTNSLNLSAKCFEPDGVLGGIDLEQYIGTDSLLKKSFGTVNAYLYALASRQLCQATMVVPGNITNTKECASGGICCLTGLKPCNDDGDCVSSGGVCDPAIKACVPGLVTQASASAKNCADIAIESGEGSIVSSISQNLGITKSDFSCQFIASSSPQASSSCTIQGCSAEADGLMGVAGEGEEYRCCANGVGRLGVTASEVPENAGTAGSAPAVASPSSIGLSACVKSGQCTLQDLLVTGANFANFLILISGAIFLAIFVYAGVLVLFGGASGANVKKGMGMVKSATVGLILMFAGYLLINFIQSSFISTAYNAKSDQCGTTPETVNMTCQIVPDVKRAKENGCITNLCNGPAERICCPFGKTNAE